MSKNTFNMLCVCFMLMGFGGMSGCDASYSNGGDQTQNDSGNDSSVNILTNNLGAEGVEEVSCGDFKFPDGPFPGSNLWDPEGGEDEGLLVAFDSRLFLEIFSAVEVFHLEEDEFGIVTTVGEFLKGDVRRDGQGRQVWGGEFPGEEYDGKVIVNVSGNLFCEFEIETPGVLVD